MDPGSRGRDCFLAERLRNVLPVTEVDHDTKVCPRCAEHIKRDALVCRFCGYDYAAAVAPPPPSPQHYVPAPNYGTNGYAIASLVLGIVWIGGLGSLLAVIFGYMARSQIKSTGGQQGGNGMAVAGIVLGIVGVVLTVWWYIAIAVAVHNIPQYHYP